MSKEKINQAVINNNKNYFNRASQSISNDLRTFYFQKQISCYNGCKKERKWQIKRVITFMQEAIRNHREKIFLLLLIYSANFYDVIFNINSHKSKARIKFINKSLL